VLLLPPLLLLLHQQLLAGLVGPATNWKVPFVIMAAPSLLLALLLLLTVQEPPRAGERCAPFSCSDALISFSNRCVQDINWIWLLPASTAFFHGACWMRMLCLGLLGCGKPALAVAVTGSLCLRCYSLAEQRPGQLYAGAACSRPTHLCCTVLALLILLLLLLLAAFEEALRGELAAGATYSYVTHSNNAAAAVAAAAAAAAAAFEEALQGQLAAGAAYSESISWRKVQQLLAIPSNWIIILQVTCGLTSCLTLCLLLCLMQPSSCCCLLKPMSALFCTCVAHACGDVCILGSMLACLPGKQNHVA
jgi:hypothetical protein